MDQGKEPVFTKESKIISTKQNDFGGPQPPPDLQVWALLARLLVFVAIIFIAAGFLD